LGTNSWGFWKKNKKIVGGRGRTKSKRLDKETGKDDGGMIRSEKYIQSARRKTQRWHIANRQISSVLGVRKGEGRTSRTGFCEQRELTKERGFKTK